MKREGLPAWTTNQESSRPPVKPRPRLPRALLHSILNDRAFSQQPAAQFHGRAGAPPRGAGDRGQGPIVTFMFCRFVMPFVVRIVALVYFCGISSVGWSSFMKINACVGMALLGFYLPDLFLNNTIARRQQSIMRAFPDALDLLLICVESGMSIESSFQRVASAIGSHSSELSAELGLPTAEIS